MLLYILAVGARGLGFVFHDQFIGEAYEAFWKTALFTSQADNHVLHEMHNADVVKMSPFVAMVVSASLLSYPVLHSPPDAEASGFA